MPVLKRYLACTVIQVSFVYIGQTFNHSAQLIVILWTTTSLVLEFVVTHKVSFKYTRAE